MKDLIIRFLTSSISEEETKVLRDWLQEPKNREKFKGIVRSNQLLDLTYRSIDTEKAYRRILEETSVEDKRWTFGISSNVLKYAAIIILLLSSSVAIYYAKNGNYTELNNAATNANTEITLELEDGSLQILGGDKRKSITNQRGERIANQEDGKIKYSNDEAGEGVEVQYNQLTVPYGKRFAVELADGTFVHLNAGTKLKYPRSFKSLESREVYLDGEAMFSVKENTSKPFIVHTDKLNVRVLGTKFNVSSYENENNTSAVLVDGSVVVYKPTEAFDMDENVILSPSQQAVLQQEDITVREVNVEKYIAWTTGELFFVNDRFENIIKELERHFDISIQNNYQDLNHIRYTGTFDSETIDQILNTFKKNSQFNYTKENGKIIIVPYE